MNVFQSIQNRVCAGIRSLAVLVALVASIAPAARAQCCRDINGSVSIAHDEFNRRLIVTASATGSGGAVRLSINGSGFFLLTSIPADETRTVFTGDTRCAGEATARITVVRPAQSCGTPPNDVTCDALTVVEEANISWETMVPEWSLSGPGSARPGEQYTMVATGTGYGSTHASVSLEVSDNGGESYFVADSRSRSGDGAVEFTLTMSRICPPARLHRLRFRDGCGEQLLGPVVAVAHVPAPTRWTLSGDAAAAQGATYTLQTVAEGYGLLSAVASLEVSTNGTTFAIFQSVSRSGDGVIAVPLSMPRFCGSVRFHRIRFTDECGQTQFSNIVGTARVPEDVTWSLSAPAQAAQGEAYTIVATVSGSGTLSSSATIQRSTNGVQFIDLFNILRTGDGSVSVSTTMPVACQPSALYRVRHTNPCGQTVFSPLVEVRRVPEDVTWTLSGPPGAAAGTTYTVTAHLFGAGELTESASIEVSDNGGVSFVNHANISRRGDGTVTQNLSMPLICPVDRLHRVRYLDNCGIARFSPVIAVRRSPGPLTFIIDGPTVLLPSTAYTLTVTPSGFGTVTRTSTVQRSTDGGRTFVSMHNVSFTGDESKTVNMPGVSASCPRLLLHRVSFNNGCGTVFSPVFAVHVPGTTRPDIAGAGDSVNAGDTAVLRVLGAPPPTGIRWVRDGVELSNGPTAAGSILSGVTTATLTISNASPSDAGDYIAVFTGPCPGEVRATLEVITCPGPSITRHPDDIETCVNQPAELRVEADSPDAFAYRWFKDGEALTDGGRFSGTETDTLLISQAHPADNGAYVCVVSTACGETISDPATLRVCHGDYNCDGGFDGGDIEAFFAAWEAGDPAADVNADGATDGGDIGNFFTAWEGGLCL
ncbi:MAG: immunoglobulin domain-containing protein [Phycisphaerae bacterium]|nr:immunoglobulin domain-containing protein [Phycisphaerae bacterium]